ncbi:CG13627 [Drosophila busckii]|uniref:CG13627 n=1 Tax=Drosophila busckii TaxID=30019 RepID=A0A0M5J9Y9_DROBS|nr:CG13627 [Drosophila busckii]
MYKNSIQADTNIHIQLEIQNIDNAEPLAPIYTVAAPNLAVQHQHIRHLEHASSLPSRGHTTKLKYTSSKSSYSSVHENETNDQTIRDPISGSQRFIAPDLDPSLKTTKLKHPTESFNIPSNNKPLPSDVLNNHLHAQPLVHILSDQTAPQTMPMYPIQFTPVAAQPIIAADHMPIYNPAYLVSLSNQLYTKHKQQLFQPNTDHGSVVKTGYVNTDLTQVVASNGQILQAAKDPQKNIHPVLQGAPQYEALVAPSAAQRQTGLPITESSLTLTSAKDGGFIVSNFYSNSRESSAYADNKAHRQHLETDPAAFELQRQQDLPQIYLEHVHLHDQDQLPLRELYIQTKSPESTETSFENNQRLINKHLVDHTPLRIFVPDEETTFETQRKQNRSDGA